MSLITIGRILNHAEQGVTSVDGRLAEDSLREALDAHAKRIIEVWDEMPIERRLVLLEAFTGQQSPVRYSEVQAAELRLCGGVPIYEQLARGRLGRPEYLGRDSDIELVRKYYAQYETGRDVRADVSSKIESIAERLAVRQV